MSLFDILSRGTGELHAVHDQETGLRAMICVADTRLGPALGGTRVYPYASEEEAIHDVVRLARAMGYKAALAGLPHGGGKSVLWTYPGSPIRDRRALFHAFGRFVDTLGGRYVACEDSGTTTADIATMRDVTAHAAGFPIERGGSGDPSPFTALGVRRGIEACAHVVLGRADLKGLHVALVGVGAVGHHLALELSHAGARLTIADVHAERLAHTAQATGAAVVPVEEIAGVACDVFAPCALGGAISDATVSRLRCRVVAGAANNQLAAPEMGAILQSRGIFYAPDYAINAGGLINVAYELAPAGYDPAASTQKVTTIYDTVAGIAERALRGSALPHEIADRMVEEILARAGAQPLVATPPSTATILARPASSRARDTAV